jgi:hypothetical protein
MRSAGWWVVAMALLTGCVDSGGAADTDAGAGALGEAGAPAGAESSDGGAGSEAVPKHEARFDSFTPQGLVVNAGGEGGNPSEGVLGPPFGVSDHCGDAIVGSDEECDDGDGGAPGELDACTDDCKTRDEASGLWPTPFKSLAPASCVTSKEEASSRSTRMLTATCSASPKSSPSVTRLWHSWPPQQSRDLRQPGPSYVASRASSPSGAPRRGHRRAAFGARSRLQPARRDARRSRR